MTTRVNLSGIDGNTGTLAESLTINAISHSTDISITSNSHVGLFVESANGNVGIGTTSPSTLLHLKQTSGNAILRINSDSGERRIDFGDSTDDDGGRIKYDASDNMLLFTNSSERMRIDSSGNVGIGTTSPSQSLHVVGEGFFEKASADSVVSVSSTSGSGRSYQIRSQTSGDFYIYDNTAGAARVTINSSGNVGIGTSSPSATLDVNGEILALSGAGTADRHIEIGVGRTGNGNSYLDLISDTTYTDYGARLIRYNTGVNTPTRLEHRGTGELSIWASDAGALQFGTSNTERMRITSGGNVGIGTASPTVDGSLAGLSVNASGTVLHIDDGDGATLKLTDPASGANRGLGISLQNTEAVISNCESGPLRFGTGNAERMRINAAGNVGIGTSSPSVKLELGGETGQYPASLKIQRSGHASSTRAAMALDNFYVMTDTPGNGTLDFSIYDNNNAGHRLTIAANGNVGIGTTSPQRRFHIHDGAATGLKITNNQSGAGVNDGFDIYVRDDNQGVELVQRENSFMTFWTNNTERLRIDNNGNIESRANRAQLTDKGVGTHSDTYTVLSCTNDYATNESGVWKDVCYIGHSPNFFIHGRTSQNDTDSNGGSSRIMIIQGHYGSVNVSNLANSTYSPGSGTVTNLEYRYLNGGAAAGNYRLQVRVTFNSTSLPIRAHTIITGHGHAQISEDN